MQNLADEHETSFRCAPGPRWAGLGVRWIDHRLPFHRSASVTPTPRSPTAVQARGEVHETAYRESPSPGLGVAWSDHPEAVEDVNPGAPRATPSISTSSAPTTKTITPATVLP